MKLSRRLYVYITVVALAGFGAAFGWLDATGLNLDFIGTDWFALLCVGMLFGELFPIRIHGEEGVETFSTSFGFALLLLAGAAPVLIAQLLTSTIADLLHRRPLNRIAFNLGQLALSWLAAAAVLYLASGAPTGVYEFHTGDLPAITGAAFIFFLVNSTLVRVAEALLLEIPLVKHLRMDFAVRAWSGSLLFALGPPIAAFADSEALLIPFVVLPMVAIHRSARQATEMEALAHHDSLTQLPNRTKFSNRLRTALDQVQSAGSHVAVMMMDLDRFKEINDTLGHDKGDALLVAVASRLQGQLRNNDLVARFGGDEFAVLATAPSTTVLRSVGERLLRALEEPIVVDGLALSVEASLGVAIGPRHGSTVEELVRHADAAMYRAKAGHGGLVMYEPLEDDNAREKLMLLNDLKRAIDTRALSMHYQPKVSLAEGSVEGVEALLRWNHPEHGWIPPNVFVAMAENTGLIKSLTGEVIRMVFEQQAKWIKGGIKIPIAINISARNLMDVELPGMIGSCLERFDVPPSLIEIEVTESMLMADPARALHLLETIRGLGIRIAIDDFGTGYSSLAYLSDLPVHTIKIDRSFVARMHADDAAIAIVRSVIDLARHLGLDTVAEGVEDRATAEQLRELGCHWAQGFGICKPQPPAILEEWLAEREYAEVGREQLSRMNRRSIAERGRGDYPYRAYPPRPAIP